MNDGDGGITTKDFVVTVTGTNDAPVIAAIAQSDLAEKTDTTALTTTIAVSFSDVDLTDTGHSVTITGIAKSGITTGLALTDTQLKALVTPGTVTKTSGSSAGSVNLAFSSASTDFDYLSVGEILTLTYTLTVNDGDGGITTKDFVVTVTGTNDAPVIAAIAQSGLTEKTDTTALTTTIAVSFSDVDLTDTGHSATITGIAKSGITSGLALTDTQLKVLVTPGTVTKTSGSSAGSVDLAFSSASTDFDYLSVGEILTLTYTLTVNDGDGGITTKDFVVTITGTNDAPVIAAMAQSDLTEKTDTSALTTTIAVSFSDVDLTDTGHSATITGIAKSGITTGLALTDTQLKALVTPGTVTKTSGSSAGSVDLAFSSASTDFDYLSVGEVLTLTYTLTINDGDGGITTKDFVVTITGTNDAPVVVSAVNSALTEDTNLTSNAVYSGITRYPFLNGLDEYPASVSFDADGKILVSGIAWTNGNPTSGVIKRFLPNGVVDTTYSVGTAPPQ